MGMAYRAPSPTYTRRLRISRRALAEFRTMIGREWISRPDGDVSNALDELIAKTPAYLVVTDCNHPDVLTYVHAIDAASGETRYAIVRDECCVTLLSAAMVQRNMRGNWTRAADGAPIDVASAGKRDAGLDRLQLSQLEAADATRASGEVITVKASSCRDNGSGICTSLTPVAFERLAPDPSAPLIVNVERSPFPIVIDHQGALADIVKSTSDGIELRLDERQRVTWQLSTSRAAELRDALDAVLPARPVVAPSSPTPEPPASRDVDESLLAEALALIEARRDVVLVRRALRSTQLALDHALEVERIARERLDAAICERAIDEEP